MSPLLVRVAKQLGPSVLDFILHGGEDYELLCTVPPQRVGTLQRRMRTQAKLRLTDIGEIRPAAARLFVESDDRRQPLATRGFSHFG